jgi:hypothetical protein
VVWVGTIGGSGFKGLFDKPWDAIQSRQQRPCWPLRCSAALLPVPNGPDRKADATGERGLREAGPAPDDGCIDDARAPQITIEAEFVVRLCGNRAEADDESLKKAGLHVMALLLFLIPIPQLSHPVDGRRNGPKSVMLAVCASSKLLVGIPGLVQRNGADF